jgi:predicted PurR-regulated permease PerM
LANRNIIVKGIEIVGVLFAAFGGFLTGIAPPQAADAKFAVGISSFLALIILFIVVALAKRRYRKVWIITGVSLFVIVIGSAYYYKSVYNELTFEYPPGNSKVEHIAGTEKTPEAQRYVSEHTGLSNAQLLAKFGGLQNKAKVWPDNSLNSARRKLVSSYVILVLAIAGAIFALTEGALRSGSTRGS